MHIFLLRVFIFYIYTMSQSPAPPVNTTVVPKLKAIEPPTFHGHVNTVDNWIFMLELYFEAIKLDYDDVDEE